MQKSITKDITLEMIFFFYVLWTSCHSNLFKETTGNLLTPEMTENDNKRDIDMV